MSKRILVDKIFAIFCLLIGIGDFCFGLFIFTNGIYITFSPIYGLVLVWFLGFLAIDTAADTWDYTTGK